jgi:hypothetical protein
MASPSDKGDMGADQVLSPGYAIPTLVDEHPVRNGEFQTLGQQWRTMSRGQGAKKIIFLASVAAAAGYYLFLGILFLLS